MADPHPAPVLVACSHGTRSPAGRRTMGQLRLAVARARPGLEVLAAHVDVQKPALDDVVARLAAQRRPMVVLPLLLSTGYHLRVDIARAVTAAGPWAVGAGLLGPEPALLDVLCERLTEAGAGPRDAIVLAAAGSSDPRADAQVRSVAGALAAVRGTPVLPGYLAAARPGVSEAVRQAAATGRCVSIASYLLAPGLFSRRLAEAGAHRVSAPLGAHPAIADLVLRRYDEAAAALAHQATRGAPAA